MKKLVAAIISLTIGSGLVIGQTTIGYPSINNYKNTDYHAAIETWDIAQDRNEICYFANNDGLLTYDGNYWKTYPLPNKAAIKSLAIDDSGRIYVGGQDEIGYFYPDRNGILSYHSIKELLPTIARQFADIWDIVIINKEVFFRTIESIFQLKNNRIRTFDAPGGWRLMTRSGSRLFAEDKEKGLHVFIDGQGFEPYFSPDHNCLYQITGILDYKNDTLLITTLKNGCYLLTGNTLTKKATPIDKLLSADLVTGAKKIDEDRYALRTRSSGLFIINANGDPIQRFSNNEGLQNNNVLAILSDHDRNLWLGLENGIDYINYNTAVRHIYPVKDNRLKSNAVRIFDQRLYIGTSNGLYTVPLDPSQMDVSKTKGVFTECTNTKGQVWSLAEINNHLLLAHQDGAFVITNNTAIPLTTSQGVWAFNTINPSGDIVAGTYTGLLRINYQNGEFKADGKVSDLYESLNVLATDDDHTIWASHPYRGVFRTPAPPDRTSISHYINYTQKDGLPSNLNNAVYFIKDKVVVATEKGVYEYDSASRTFIPSPVYKPIFGDNSVEYLTEDKTGNIWFVSNQRVGVIDYSKTAANSSGSSPSDLPQSSPSPYSIIYFPELTAQTVRGAAFIYPYDPENIFIGSNNGILHLNYSNYIKSDTSLKVVLGAVKAIAERDSLIFGGYFLTNPTGSAHFETQPTLSFPNHWNSFHFEYSSPVYTGKNNVTYSYQLAGFDKGWSEWTSRTEKDYTNLPYGRYTFLIRARNNLGNTSAPVSYSFTVNPAWYQTIWAYVLYLLAGIGILLFINKRQQRNIELHQKRHKAEQEHLNYLHSLELDRKEKGIIALQNEVLEGELQFSNKALATTTMHLVERGGLLLNIKQELMGIIKRLNIPNGTHEFRAVFKMMNDTDKNDDDWNRFSIYFDKVHNNFLSSLKTKFPQLSPTDLKLCAYLRLNLTSKEIAQLLNISPKGVEVSRYRIRKKLNLPTETNLYDFLIEVTTPPPGGAIYRSSPYTDH